MRHCRHCGEPRIRSKSMNNGMVRLRYYGGSFENKNRTRCATCGHKASVNRSRVMSESIQFPSDVTPSGLKTVLFAVGRDYYVTEYEADYLLKMTFVNINGVTEPKFRKVEDDGREATHTS